MPRPGNSGIVRRRLHTATCAATRRLRSRSEAPLRQYQFQATDSTISSLRRLRGAWSGFIVSDLSVVVTLADGSAVRLQVEGADVEDAFEAFRLEAFVDPSPEGDPEAAGDFAAGGNDVVLFTGATWSETGAARVVSGVVETPITPDSVVHFSGHPGQLPESAEIVCITTDAIVVATGQGSGVLIRTGLKPYSLDVIRDARAIAAFLKERSYPTGEDEPGE